MLDRLTSLFRTPKASGPPQVIRRFDVSEPTIAVSGVAVEEGALRIDAGEPQTFPLFEVEQPHVDRCLLAYRARLKSDALEGRAYLEMWCRFAGRGEFFSKGLNQSLSGTMDWASYEIPFELKKGQEPDLIKLNLVVEGIGTVWARDIELLRTPLG